jgi:hypothetical protein
MWSVPAKTHVEAHFPSVKVFRWQVLGEAIRCSDGSALSHGMTSVLARLDCSKCAWTSPRSLSHTPLAALALALAIGAVPQVVL